MAHMVADKATTSGKLRSYYYLTKPGIIYGNILTAAAGFFFASRGHIDFFLFIATLLGTSLVIACACVVNNYTDRGIDKHMARTKKRALVSGSISARSALVYAAVLGIVGLAVLILFTNSLVVGVGLVGFIDYVLLYGVSKRRSVHGTIVGSISGATPILAGYVAVTSHLDTGAWLVLIIMVLWQMPHFYAIAMYRQKDYAAADIPVLPVVKGFRSTKIQIVGYVVAYLVAISLPTLYGYTGYIYLVVMLAISSVWLYRGLLGFKLVDDVAWARKMFFFSLLVVLVQSVMLSLGPLLP